MIEILAKDNEIIPYRKELNNITGGITATILLQQIIYRYTNNHNKAFYKFKEPCSHEKYNDGDSWCEELGFTRKEFDTAFKKLEDIGLVSKKINMDRLTFYDLNVELLEEKLDELYLKYKRGDSKVQKGLYVKQQRGVMESNKGALVYIDTENTTENTQRIQQREITRAGKSENQDNSTLPPPSPPVKKKKEKNFNLEEIEKEVSNEVNFFKHPINFKSYREWVEERKIRKKPLTKLAIKKQFKFLMKYSHDVQTKIIDTSISAGYAGLFEPKKEKAKEFRDKHGYTY